MVEEWTGAGQPVGAWSTGGSLNTARASGAGGGTTTAAIYFGGVEPSTSAKTEIYDGESWTEVNDLTAASAFMAGFGTSTSAVAFGGNPTPSRAVTPTNVQGADVFQNLIRGLRVARSSQGEFETGSPTDATNVLTQYDRMRNFEKLPGAFDFRPTLSKRDTVDPVRPPFRPKKIVK